MDEIYINIQCFGEMSLQSEQLDAGVPILTSDEVIDDTRFLQNLNSSSHARLVAPSAEDYASNPILKWTDCAILKEGSVDVMNVDLETRARVNIGDRVLFADVSQGDVNMCTSMAFAQGYSLLYALTHDAGDFEHADAVVAQLSGVYAYYFQRVEECLTAQVCICSTCAANPACLDGCNPPCVDCGSYLRSAATVFSRGVCLSAAWPYTKAPKNINEFPSATARLNSLSFRVSAIKCLSLIGAFQEEIVGELRSNHPVVVFLNLTDAQVRWMKAQQNSTATEIDSVILPEFVTPSTTPVGHVVICDGYSQGLFLLRNNFGNSWGANGRFGMRQSQMTIGQVHSSVSIQSICGPPPDKVMATLGFNAATTCPR